MCFHDDDDTELYRQAHHTARKAHRCDECCKDAIVPGQRYLRVEGLFEGEWFTLKLCGPCNAAHERVFSFERAHGCHPSESRCPIGYLHEHLYEHDMDVDDLMGPEGAAMYGLDYAQQAEVGEVSAP